MRHQLMLSSALACLMADDTGLSISQQAAVTEPPADGKRARRAFMMKQFIPGNMQEWTAANVVAKGVNAPPVRVGRVYGVCTSAEEKFNDINGDQTRSITMYGSFQTEGYLTGELGEATTVYLPLSFSEKVFTAFKADPTIKVIELDCDIGLAATGKPIPYEWVVISYVEGKEMDALSRLRNRRARPAGVSDKLPAYQIQALPAPVKTDGVQEANLIEQPALAASEGLDNGDVIEGEKVGELEPGDHDPAGGDFGGGDDPQPASEAKPPKGKAVK